MLKSRLVIAAASALATMSAYSTASDVSFLDLVQHERQVHRQMIELQVQQGLKAARDQLSVDAREAVGDLKILLEAVTRAVDLDAETRAKQLNKLESAIREASRQAAEQAERRVLAQQSLAISVERERLLASAARNEIKISQLMARIVGLMKEQRYQEAEQAVVPQIRELADGDPAGESIVYNTRFVANVEKMAAHRELRHKHFVDALYQVELSHVPFPDEPPIVYQPAESWRLMTMKRLKYPAVDLARQGRAEEKIFAALEETTKFDFLEMPLQDVIDYLSDLHRILIVIDGRALDTIGLGTDTPITQRLDGISLRSALRLMLKEYDLTYVVQDEVLQITTQEEAETNLVNKVYSVGDLVVPIQQTGLVNPFQTGGGLGAAFNGNAGNDAGGQGRFGEGMNGLNNNLPGIGLNGAAFRGLQPGGLFAVSDILNGAK